MNQNKPRIKRHFAIIAHGPDTIELRHGVWNPLSFTINDESQSGNLYKLLTRLDGSMTSSELAKEESIAVSEVEALVDHLLQLGVIEFGSSTALDYYLDTMVPALARMGGSQRLDRPLLLLGDPDLCGELLRLLSASLTDIPVERVDSSSPGWRTVQEPDNSWLLNGLAFEQKMNVFDSWKDKFVVFAQKTINPIALQIWNRAAIHFGVPWIHAVMDGPFLLIGPTFVPPYSACYECLEMRVLMNLRESASYVAYKKALVAGQVRGGILPVEPALLGVLASHASLEVCNYCLTRSTFTVNKILAIYLPTMEFSFNEVLKVPGCPACGSSSEKDDQELYFDMRAVIKTA